MGFSYKGLATAAFDRGRRLADDHGETASHLVGQAGSRLQAAARNEQVQEIGFALIEGVLGPRASAAAEKAVAGRTPTPVKKPPVKKATAKKTVARKTTATPARIAAAKEGTTVKKAAGLKKAAASKNATASKAPGNALRTGRAAHP